MKKFNGHLRLFSYFIGEEDLGNDEPEAEIPEDSVSD